MVVKLETALVYKSVMMMKFDEDQPNFKMKKKMEKKPTKITFT